MAKITLSNIGTGTAFQTAISTINANNDAIETALDNTLSRDGTVPNTMSSNLDMNSNHLLNLPTPSSSTEPLRLGDITSIDGTFITAATGTSGHYVPFLDGNNTHSGNNTFSGTNTFSGVNTFSNTIAGNCTISGNNTHSGNLTLSGTNTFSGINSFTSIVRIGNNIASGLARVAPTQPFPLFVDRLINWSNINDNTIVDGSDITPVDSVSNQFCSFVAYPRVTNTAFNLSHFCGFEDLKQYLGSGTLTNDWSFLSWPTISGPVTSRSAFRVEDAGGAGAVTNQYGLYVASLTRGTANWGVYTLGTTPSYIGGNVLIGTAGTAPTTPALTINKNAASPLSPALATNLLQLTNVDGTGTNIEMNAFGTGAVASFSSRSARGTKASPSAIQSGDAITSWFGSGYGTNAFDDFTGVIQLTAAENFSNTANGSYWSIFTTQATTTTLTERARVGQGLMLNTYASDPGAGALIAGSSIKSLSATAGIGYATGAGSTVTQGTSRTTGVTINNVSGAITLFTAAGSTTAASFTVTNSAVAATDTIILNQKSGSNSYILLVTSVSAGAFNITFYTTGGTASDAPVINFNVIKGVAS